MNPYPLSILSLLLAAIAQTSIAWVATERFLEKGQSRRQNRAWLAFALSASCLALQHAHALELALRTGLYDLPQALLAGLVALFFALGTYGLKPPQA